MNVREHVTDRNSMTVDSEGNTHSLRHFDQISIVQEQTRVRNAQIGHHEDGGDVGMVVASSAQSHVVLFNGYFLKNALVKVVTVNDLHV